MPIDDHLLENPYLLMTPGPLSTTKTVRQAMLRDWCTWDADYNRLVTEIRERLVRFATADVKRYTTVLMQGSGTFAVEAVIGTVVPDDGKLLVLANGAYGRRIGQIADVLRVPHAIMEFAETTVVDPDAVARHLAANPSITHVCLVHSETTTGMLNPLCAIVQVVKQANRICIVDAMSSFGGMEMDVANLDIDYLISSPNKCIQGVPGFAFVIAKRSEMETIGGRARSLSLDLYGQWKTMEDDVGKWRYTSPTHTVRAFYQALLELADEGGVAARYERYRANQRKLVEGMRQLGFATLLADTLQSPFITAFLYPQSSGFSFPIFYEALKRAGFVIYPGKVTDCDTFRVGSMGEIYSAHIERFLTVVSEIVHSCG